MTGVVLCGKAGVSWCMLDAWYKEVLLWWGGKVLV